MLSEEESLNVYCIGFTCDQTVMEGGLNEEIPERDSLVGAILVDS